MSPTSSSLPVTVSTRWISTLFLNTTWTRNANGVLEALEDKTGEINVSVFTRQYEQFGKNIHDGDVLAFTGNVVAEEKISNTSSSEEGGEEIVMKFFANGIRKIKKAAKAYYLPVRSFYGFLARDEKEFRRRYEEAGGHPLMVFDELTGTIRKMMYCVSDDALHFEKMQEYC